MDIGKATDVGKRRTRNEDSLVVDERPDRPDHGLLCAVADGMGGHAAGDVASQIAIETLTRQYYDQSSQSRAALKGAVQQANRAVWESAAADPARHGMGTTLVCAAVLDRRAFVANVGDSQAFVVTGGSIHQVTRDHTWVVEQVEQGKLSPAEAEQHPFRHVLTRSLGAAAEVEVDLYEVTLPDGATLVLCSDGLTKHVQPEEIKQAVEGVAAQEAAQRLVVLANERGGSDNTTVIVVQHGS